MKVRVTSWRGDHNGDVAEVEVAQAIFEKYSGKRTEALPEAYKAKVPDTFGELKALWTDGKIEGCTPIGLDENGEIVAMKEFNPAVREMVVLQPIAAG